MTTTPTPVDLLEETILTATKLTALPKVRLSLLHRVYCFLWLWGTKLLASLYFTYQRLRDPPAASTRPTLTTRLPSRPTLETRIFYPPTYNPRSPTQLPTYFNIHGGGFALCTAAVDDAFCRAWSTRTGMLVISLDYRKIPLHAFPTATHDVAAQIHDLLAHRDDLPIDRARLAIGGFSAGGNLALSVAQLPALKRRFRAAVIYYPIVDFSHPPTHKMATRPYADYRVDHLGSAGWWLDWGYVCPGQDRRDPLLSPWYAHPDDLPPCVYMVAAEYDMLRLEAQEMIHRLAGWEDRIDKEEPFERGGYKWTLARGCRHGFTHGMPKGKRSRRVEVREQIYEEAAGWLGRCGVLG
ncbi:alpha/beta hydrolase fold protein [Aspergillus homomorphus CBS 101889]|uniref:Alpha/beta hydrolase fold protein n=1 Tax=Aspergillus homomorphus (strain CBS 101889) TaxID=1450537 RepID=A0A395HWH9_ASPHC|nr:alpha/beta hydrolase fold protein [Aspergillus homomorphus CBS 101889]RAL11785.1 alpha/beta hydrolase fold protein [Aspergillus homomorphus CBS 101889]